MRYLVLFFVVSSISGCAQFLTPDTPLMTGTQRAAYHAEVNAGVAQTAGGLGILYGMNRLLEHTISDEEIQNKWIPGGVKNYVRNALGNASSDKQLFDDWGFIQYTARISGSDDWRLYVPFNSMARFCVLAGNEFKQEKFYRTNFPSKDQLRSQRFGTDPYGGANFLQSNNLISVDARMDLYESLERAATKKALGDFVCKNKSGEPQWWVEIALANDATMNNNMPGFSLPIKVRPWITPINTKTSSYGTRTGDYERYLQLMRDTIDNAWSQKEKVSMVDDESGYHLSAWPSSSYDRHGCAEITYQYGDGDRIFMTTRNQKCDFYPIPRININSPPLCESCLSKNWKRYPDTD